MSAYCEGSERWRSMPVKVFFIRSQSLPCRNDEVACTNWKSLIKLSIIEYTFSSTSFLGNCTVLQSERRKRKEGESGIPTLLIHLWKLLCGQMIFFQTRRFSSFLKYPKAVRENIQKEIIKTDWRKSVLQIRIKYLLFLKHYNFSEARRGRKGGKKK